MHILFVDAGNYCRSPVAEAVFRAKVRAYGRNNITTASAGLKDKHAGDSADPRSLVAAQARGYDLNAFRAREITHADWQQATLILAMDKENLSQLEARRPAGNQASVRLFLETEEVADPYFGGEAGFSAMMDQIEAGVEALLKTL
jgi:protein-tyrosine phosphatase